MATTTLTIDHGTIVDYVDRYFQSISEDGKEYFGNGWHVTIQDGRNGRPGRIICHAERIYADSPAICHREFKLADGTIGLSGGNIYSRYAYFRTAEFQQFLNKFALTAIRKEDPNQTFSSRPDYSGFGNLAVWSNGRITRKYDYDEKITRYTVSDATWAIVKNGNATLLYTLVKNVFSLEESLMDNLEIGGRVRVLEQEKLIWALNGTRIRSVDDLEKIIDKACEVEGIKSLSVSEIASKISDPRNKDYKFKIRVYREYGKPGEMRLAVSYELPDGSWRQSDWIAKGKLII